MISQNQIARLVDQEEYRQLVDRILTNGRCRSKMAQRVLTRPEVAAPAAIGLALQRVAEITYGPTDLANSLGRRLIAMQRRDGLFTIGQQPSNESLLAASATAIRGLMTWTNQHQSESMSVHSPIKAAIDQGLAAIARLYSASTDLNADAVGWAIVLWQLGDHATFRRLVPVPDLLAMVDDSAADLVEQELCRYAHAMAA